MPGCVLHSQEAIIPEMNEAMIRARVVGAQSGFKLDRRRSGQSSLRCSCTYCDNCVSAELGPTPVGTGMSVLP
jgi:hypothetical protein